MASSTFDILQDALAELVERTKSVPHQPTTRISGLMPRQAQLEAPPGGAKGKNVIHPAPSRHMTDWRSSDHSSDEEQDGEQEEPSQKLVAAAMFLLHDSTLAGAAGAGWQATPLPLRNWDDFVQQQIGVNVRAAASSKLLATRNAVPSHSSRMVFASQVGTATSLGVSPCRHELVDCMNM